MSVLEVWVDEGLQAVEPRDVGFQLRLRGIVGCALCWGDARGAALRACPLCIRFADDDSVRSLNARWRRKDQVTDVLSFPMQDPPDFSPSLPLGDVVLAWPFVTLEAERLSLPPTHHALHLVVHGVLHLLGHDHQEEAEALRMQACERRVLGAFGLHDPYPR